LEKHFTCFKKKGYNCFIVFERRRKSLLRLRLGRCDADENACGNASADHYCDYGSVDAMPMKTLVATPPLALLAFICEARLTGCNFLKVVVVSLPIFSRPFEIF
jgi:hypothetical protein